MIKKKLHTLQYLQNKESIQDELRRLGLLEHREMYSEDLLNNLRSKMDELNRQQKKSMRRAQIFFWSTMVGCISMIGFLLYLMITHQ